MKDDTTHGGFTFPGDQTTEETTEVGGFVFVADRRSDDGDRADDE